MADKFVFVTVFNLDKWLEREREIDKYIEECAIEKYLFLNHEAVVFELVRIPNK